MDELTPDIYTIKQDVFSRNSGLIETDWLDEMCAVISGCGSVGSCVALQLARSGVGRFVLIDTDWFESSKCGYEIRVLTLSNQIKCSQCGGTMYRK